MLVLKGGGWVGAWEPSPGRRPADAEGAKINRENFRQEIKCRIEVNFTDFKIEILNLCISFNLESLFRRILGHVFSKLNSSTKSGHD